MKRTIRPRRRRHRRTLIDSPLARWPFAIVATAALLSGMYTLAALCAAVAWAGWTPRQRTQRKD